MNPIANLASNLTHGARPIMGSPDRSVNGQPVVRLGDMIDCPIHGVNPIITVTATSQTDNKPVATVTSVAHCGAVIISGSPNTYTG